MHRLTLFVVVIVFVLVGMPTQIADEQRVHRPTPTPVPNVQPSATSTTKSKEKTPEYRESIMEATAYCHTGNRTFTGTWPKRGTIAVDPKVIPLGTELWVEGYGHGIAEDTGGAIKGQIIDVFMESECACWEWGRRKVKVRVYE